MKTEGISVQFVVENSKYINKCGTENKKNCQKICLCLLIPAGIVSSTR